jgi:hypothetical protein
MLDDRSGDRRGHQGTFDLSVDRGPSGLRDCRKFVCPIAQAIFFDFEGRRQAHSTAMSLQAQRGRPVNKQASGYVI